MKPNDFKFGWRKDAEDARDFTFSAKVALEFAQLPRVVDLRKNCPIVVDQGPLNSCVGNAIAGVLQIRQVQQGKIYYDPLVGRTRPYGDYVFAPSRLFIYYGARELEGTQNEDDGAQIRNGMKFVSKNGAATSSVWPYRKNNVNVKPSEKAYQVALERGEMLGYHRIHTTNSIDKLRCLAEGRGIVFGFLVFSNFLSATVEQTGHVKMPKASDIFLGGHAAVIVGYNLSTKRYLCRNSWGPIWGDGGYFTMPFEYLDTVSLAGDFWTVTQVE